MRHHHRKPVDHFIFFPSGMKRHKVKVYRLAPGEWMVDEGWAITSVCTWKDAMAVANGSWI